MFDVDLRPVGVQLFGNQHGQAGPDALAHFRMAKQDGDTIVIGDSQEGIWREDIALVLGTQSKSMAAGDDKRHHQPTAKHRTALEKTTA